MKPVGQEFLVSAGFSHYKPPTYERVMDELWMVYNFKNFSTKYDVKIEKYPGVISHIPPGHFYIP